MELGKFKPETKDTVAWHLRISEETDIRFSKFQKEHGKHNKTQLVDWLLQQYMEQEQFKKDNDENK